MLLETCGRCFGKGTYTVKLGVPGQDVRKVGMRNVKWLPVFGPFRCGACDGHGMRKARKLVVGRFRIPPD